MDIRRCEHLIYERLISTLFFMFFPFVGFSSIHWIQAAKPMWTEIKAASEINVWCEWLNCVWMRNVCSLWNRIFSGPALFLDVDSKKYGTRFMSDIIIRRLHETHDAHKLDTSIETINVGIFQKINSMCDLNLLLLIYSTLLFYLW